MASPFRFSSWLAAIALLGAVVVPEAAIAQSAVTRRSQAVSIFVDPVRGHDRQGTGSELAPLRTITRALSVAQPNTVIILSPGTYSAATGERFPLRLRSGVTLYGDPEGRGAAVTIAGGGRLDTRLGRQHAAILGADGAGLNGVTVSNSGGIGVWIPSGNLWVVNSTFRGNGGDAIALAGSSSPVVRNNRYLGNGGGHLNRLDRPSRAPRSASSSSSNDVPVLAWGSANLVRPSRSPAATPARRSPSFAYSPPRRYTPPRPAPGGLMPLPVPDPNPPVGDRGDTPLPSSQPLSQMPGAPPPPPLTAIADVSPARLQFRILVTPRNDYEASLVQLLVPDAFTVRRGDGTVTQAGAFRNRDRAEAVLQELTRNGMNARIEALD